MTDDAFTTSVRIAAPPDEVFPYLTDAALMVRWMGDWADLQAEPGRGRPGGHPAVAGAVAVWCAPG